MAALWARFTWEHAWIAFGVTGMVIFYGRFYVQWIASERQKKSVIPVAFWYMSSVGSVMQFIYAVHRVSPGAAFGQCFNIVIYMRNLVHIWRERGRLTQSLNVAAHALAGLIAAVAVVFMLMTWLSEYKANQSIEAAQAARNWFWLGVWGAGQLQRQRAGASPTPRRWRPGHSAAPAGGRRFRCPSSCAAGCGAPSPGRAGRPGSPRGCAARRRS